MINPAIRQANNGDISNLARFIANSDLIHRHLDWRSVLDWVDTEPFLILEQDKRIQAILSCPADPENISWVRCFASQKTSNYTDQWHALIEKAKKHPSLKQSTLCVIGLQDWLVTLLQSSGFHLLQQIVVLQWDGRLPPNQTIELDILLRPMELSDLDAVARVDKEAFEPIWVLSKSTLHHAWQQSEHAYVAELEDQVIGYEMSSVNHFSAHLARLAVLPSFTGKNIGHTLVREMLTHYKRLGIHQISVNTQNDNQASLNLYTKTGFIPNGERFPVYILEIQPD